MDAARGIPDQHEALGCVGIRPGEAQGVGEAPADEGEIAQMLAQAHLDLGREGRVVERLQRLGQLLGGRPDQGGAAFRHRQHGEGTVGEEALDGHAAMRERVREGGDEPDLPVAPGAHADAGGLAGRGAPPLGRGDERRLDGRAIGQLDAWPWTCHARDGRSRRVPRPGRSAALPASPSAPGAARGSPRSSPAAPRRSPGGRSAPSPASRPRRRRSRGSARPRRRSPARRRSPPGGASSRAPRR